MSFNLPLILEPAELARNLSADNLLIVDLCKAEIYAYQHIPGAVHLEYAHIIAAEPPVMGLLPDDEQLSEVFSAIGMTKDSHVVAYDDEGGGKASRLLWTLDVIGHQGFSLLNGGLRAWLADQHPVDKARPQITLSDYQVSQSGKATVDKAYLLAHLNDPEVALLDARTPAEYRGIDMRAGRGGHIPRAVNMDWTLALDAENNGRLKLESELRALLAARDITPDKEIITYCQTHHRSSHTYIVLKALGYPRIKGYPGGWSEWGNSEDTPIE